MSDVKEQLTQKLQELGNERNLFLYTRYLQGARMMLLRLVDAGVRIDFCDKRDKDKDVYNKAIIRFLLDNIRNVEAFLNGDELRYVDHKRNDKGKLISCRVARVKKRIIYEEVE